MGRGVVQTTAQVGEEASQIGILKTTTFVSRSIWSPTYADVAQREADIDDILAMIRINGGTNILHKSMSYLLDRLVKVITN